MTAFWNGVVCSVVETDRRFRAHEAYGAVNISEKSIKSYETTRCNM
jgi:hypothetical protein